MITKYFLLFIINCSGDNPSLKFTFFCYVHVKSFHPQLPKGPAIEVRYISLTKGIPWVFKMENGKYNNTQLLFYEFILD